MGEIKKLAKETVIYGTSSIIGRFLNWLLVPLYTRIFLPEEYGIVANLYAYVAFLLILLTYGMETGYFRFSEKSNDHVYSTILLSILTTSVIFVAVVVLFLSQITGFLLTPGFEIFVLMIAIIVSIDAFMAIPFARLRKENKPVKFASIKLLHIGINIGLNIFFLIICRKAAATDPYTFPGNFYSENFGIGYIFLSNFIASVGTLLLLYKEIFSVQLKVDLKLLKRIFLYSFPLLIVGVAGQVNENIEKIIYPFVSTDAMPMYNLGIYSANLKIAVIMTMFIQAYRYAADPFFFSNAKKIDANMLYAQSMKYFVVLGLGIFIGVVVFIDVIKFFIDEKYWEGLRIIPMVLIANLMLGIFYNLSVWYKINDKTRFGAYFAIIGAVITVVINLALIPVISYHACAIAKLACYSAMAVLSYIVSRKHYAVQYHLKSIAIYFIVAFGIVAVNNFITIDATIFKYMVKILLIFTFLLFVFFYEKLYKSILYLKSNDNER